MRIAVYYDLAFGGAANALALFVAHLRTRHEVDVFHPPGAQPVAPDTRELTGIGPMPRHRVHFWNRVSHPAYFRQLADKERELAPRLADYDRVMVHSCRGRGAPALLSSLSPPGVFYVTEPLRMYREPRFPDGGSPWLWALARGLYTPVSRRLNRDDAGHGNRAGRILANSRYTAARVEEVYGQDAGLAYPPVDPLFLDAPLGRGEGGYVLSPGAILPPKGHGRVIRALARLPRPRPRLMLAGTPVSASYLRRMRRLARKHDVELEIRPAMDPDDYLECVRRARVVVVAAVREPLGLVSLEAQALGRPVVVVAEGGLPETLAPGPDQSPVSPDPEPLAESIQRALERREPQDLSRAWVRSRFSAEVCGTRLEEALCE